jgi:hypothetical protein
MRRLGPAATHPRGVRALAPAADLGCSPARGRAAPHDHSRRPVGCTTTVTIVRAGARCAPFAGGVTTPFAGGRAARPLRLSSGRGPTHLFAGVVTSPFDGRGPRGPRDCRPGGGRCTLFAGGVSRPSVGQLAARHTRLVAGRGPLHPIAGAVYAQHGGQRAAADSESGARAGAPIPLSHSARRPAGRSGLRVGRPGRGPDSTVTPSTAASGPQQTPSRAPGSGPRLHCQPADGPRGQPQPSRPGPGPRPGRDSDSQQARAVRQSVGPSAARPRAAGAVSLGSKGRQSGRCGVLTRIRVGAAAAAGLD